MSAKQNRPVGESRAARDNLSAADTILRDTHAKSDDWWRDCAERAVSWWAEAGVPFTSDDARDLGVPEADHPARWGALFSAMRARGVIEPIGFRTSARKSRHGGILRVWRGVAAQRSAVESGVTATPLAAVSMGRLNPAILTPLSQVSTGATR